MSPIFQTKTIEEVTAISLQTQSAAESAMSRQARDNGELERASTLQYLAGEASWASRYWLNNHQG